MREFYNLVEQFDTPAVVVNRDAVIVASNRVYLSALNAFGFNNEPTIYAFGGPETQIYLERAIAGALDDGDLHHAMLPIKRSFVRAAATFAPISDVIEQNPLTSDLCLGLFHLVNLSPKTGLAIIKRDYELTEQELYFATHLVSGLSLQEAASHMDMTLDVAKARMQAVLAKTGTASIDDLSHLIDEAIPA